MDLSFSTYLDLSTPKSTEADSDSWNCAPSTDCQNVYSLNFNQADTLTIAVSSVTGSSVVRLAVFSGTALNGTNLLNGATTDKECNGQDVGETATVSIPSAGPYSLTVGRDWGNSMLGAGTYSLSLSSTLVSMLGFTKTSSNTATQSSGYSCP
ncbi:hypothetical protein CH352_18190 [Leptospira hartskeerlii]|uniref:Peptidase C-terminal archaeal/bacterial domain-containing protein n=2 Tax=Leptospira hartskeerlii TaxID=2023177 RepID=A0A2M9X8G8_9LEPT|nr:hypothetical protein CH357_18340 [Leptospira hartskeerlii]PJZ32056.1 hypothetical protein CH352_18190 [Leptospira hartskeerlii]